MTLISRAIVAVFCPAAMRRSTFVSRGVRVENGSMPEGREGPVPDVVNDSVIEASRAGPDRDGRTGIAGPDGPDWARPGGSGLGRASIGLVTCRRCGILIAADSDHRRRGRSASTYSTIRMAGPPANLGRRGLEAASLAHVYDARVPALDDTARLAPAESFLIPEWCRELSVGKSYSAAAGNC